jgi:CO/xanthine dehydrogenase FAD-binding subunit
MRYTRPESLQEVTAALAEGDAVVIGGGTMVVPDMTHGRTVAAAVVDLCRAGLGGIETHDGGWLVGATTSYAAIERSSLPLLTRVARGITGGPQIRHRGTAGGSACYANPGSDVPAVLVALGATLRLVSTDGVREVPASKFFRGAFSTARRPNEVLAALVVPPIRGAVGYHKFKLAEGSWPIVTATCVAQETLSVVLGGAAGLPVPVVVDRPSLGTSDPAWRARLNEVVHHGLTEVGGGWDDVLAPGHYRARIAPAIAARAVADALGEERA